MLINIWIDVNKLYKYQQGENIADNGGVKQAFHAYKHWLQRHDAADETLPGLNHTHTQLFFLNFAQVFTSSVTFSLVSLVWVSTKLLLGFNRSKTGLYY